MKNVGIGTINPSSSNTIPSTNLFLFMHLPFSFLPRDENCLIVFAMAHELTYEMVAFSYSEDRIPTNNAKNGIIGQKRAIDALRLGLSLDRIGYNIFVSGDAGTGRLTAIRQEVRKIAGDTSALKDCVYVANPADPTQPLSILFPPGKGKAFASALEKAGSLEDGREDALHVMESQYPESAAFLALLKSAPYDAQSYKANLVLDRHGAHERPLIIESHPSFENIFGYYDEKAAAPHLGIHIGSFDRAGGGFLVLTAEELLAKKGLWDALKRHLDASYMALGSSAVQGSIGKGGMVRPQPIPQITKVILLGSDDLYDHLSEKDEQFLRLFKIAPQFDYQMKASRENISGTISYLEHLAKGLLPLTKEAIAETLRYSAWFAEDQESLTTQLSLLGDLVSEAEFLAKDNGKSSIGKNEIRQAIKQREFFSSIVEARINHEIADGELVINLTGTRIGIVNGLAVMDRGLASFGMPTVISVTVAPGSEGIVNIEHEAGLSGEIHDKGILILEGFLRKQYARTFPLSIYAGICFEQNYAEIDGDSASSSELYALLSAIGEIPVRQDIAITGSVNQMGIVQPVGGINEKILGFYKACKTGGLSGHQGVIIPQQNIRSLILDYEVEDAIRDGRFHIWAVGTIMEGMELLTGMKSGGRDGKGLFPIGTFNRRIEDRLKKLYEAGANNR